MTTALLSPVAQSFLWMGRRLERAEGAWEIRDVLVQYASEAQATDTDTNGRTSERCRRSRCREEVPPHQGLRRPSTVLTSGERALFSRPTALVALDDK